jgi:hypothetical protein
MKRLPSRLVTFGVAVLVAVAFAVAGGLYSGGHGSASASSRVQRLQDGRLDPKVLDALGHFGKEAGVSLANVAEVGVVGTTTHQRAAFLGADTTGRPRISFLSGDSLSNFALVSELISSENPMWVTTSASGPSTTQVGEVGLVGILMPSVAQVEIARADGTVTRPELLRWHGYSFFTLLTQNAAEFPTSVRALSSSGKLLLEKDVHIGPLCALERPNCV